jgi:hypothetical protein
VQQLSLLDPQLVIPEPPGVQLAGRCPEAAPLSDPAPQPDAAWEPPSLDDVALASPVPRPEEPASSQPSTWMVKVAVVVCGGRGNSPPVTPASVTETVVVDPAQRRCVGPVAPSLHV